MNNIKLSSGEIISYIDSVSNPRYANDPLNPNQFNNPYWFGHQQPPKQDNKPVEPKKSIPSTHDVIPIVANVVANVVVEKVVSKMIKEDKCCIS
jgi:hypothetical protein